MAACALLSSASGTRLSNSTRGCPFLTCWPRLTRTRVITPARSARAGIHSPGSTFPLVESMLMMASRLTRVNSTSSGCDFLEISQATRKPAATTMRARKTRPRVTNGASRNDQTEVAIRSAGSRARLARRRPRASGARVRKTRRSRTGPSGWRIESRRLDGGPQFQRPLGKEPGKWRVSPDAGTSMRRSLGRAPGDAGWHARSYLRALGSPARFHARDRSTKSSSTTRRVLHQEHAPAETNRMLSVVPRALPPLANTCRIPMGSNGFRPGRVPESAPHGSRRPWNRMAISIVPKSSLSLFQNQQGLAGSDSVAVLNTHFEDMSGARSFHFVLHFHGFHHDQAGAYIYRVALLDEQADYLARHGRGDVLASAAEGRFRAFGGIARVADFDPKAAAVGLCFAGQADFEAAAIDQDGKHARLDFLRAVELIFID